MRAAINLLALDVAVFAVAFAVRRLFLSDVMPVSWEQEPQPTLALQAAFLLRAIENVTIIVAAIMLAAALALWLDRRCRRNAR